ncbi:MULTISPECIES: DUF6516 family protein [unclassified Caballeronia]|uniref:toxin-antitoxin system TumE family protein n=1 Tax=unclassified Caballeronia TaxID=2646786 RepID=UPI002028A5FF|nr:MULTISPECIES: DUF6516 family protein [unclassified Caballeronia]MDR5799407.1 DUF6516 family protein [Caballeronia sp. LZ001]
MSNTKAVLIEDRRSAITASGFAETVIWRLPHPVPGCRHLYKYRLAYVISGQCVLRYDNERDKGDHRHFVGNETPYMFSTIERLLADFQADVNIWNRWRSR